MNYDNDDDVSYIWKKVQTTRSELEKYINEELGEENNARQKYSDIASKEVNKPLFTNEEEEKIFKLQMTDFLSSKNTQKKMGEEYLPYESNKYTEKYPCAECKNTNVFTRVYYHPTLHRSFFLCYNCAEEFVTYKDFKPVEYSFFCQEKRE